MENQRIAYEQEMNRFLENLRKQLVSAEEGRKMKEVEIQTLRAELLEVQARATQREEQIIHEWDTRCSRLQNEVRRCSFDGLVCLK